MEDQKNPIIPARDTEYIIKLPTLQKGDKGEYVAVLKRLLQDCGYLIAKDDPENREDCFDSYTFSAILQFQRDWGLNETGVVDDITWKYLETSPERADTYTVTIRSDRIG